LTEVCIIFLLFRLLFLKFSRLLIIQNLVLDKISFVLSILCFWLFVVVFVISVKYKTNIYFSKYKRSARLLLFFLIFSILSSRFIRFYICFEVSLIPLMWIIVGWGYQRERIQATFYLFIYTMVGSLPLLFVILIVLKTKTLIWLAFFFNYSDRSNIQRLLLMFVLLRFFIKLPVFGLHLWLPKAHVEAPVAGSIILAAILLKFRAYGLFRMLFLFSRRVFLWGFLRICVLYGSIIARVVAVGQRDIKSLVAYSSVRHIGVIVCGIFFRSKMSALGTIIVAIMHGLCSSVIFFRVNFFYEKRYSRQILTQRGNLIVYPGLPLLWFLSMAANFSAPPFARLVGELIVMIRIVFVNFLFVLIIIFIGFFAAYFCMFFFRSILHGKPSMSLFLTQTADLFFLVFVCHIVPSILYILKLRPER